MASCLDNIVAISGCQGRETSISGFDLMDAPEISPKNLNNAANEFYVQGTKLAEAQLNLAITQVRNDFIGALGANQIATTVVEPVYSTASFVDNMSYPADGKERGTTLYKSGKLRDRVRKTKGVQVEVFPLENHPSTELRLYDNGMLYTYPVQLVANQINVFDIDHFVQGDFVRVVFENVGVRGAKITCMLGCNGTTPNDCGYAKGWDGTREVKNEGYGINVKFKCECDYDEILCDMAKGAIGEIVWTKARINILKVQYKTNRFNNFVVYGHDELEKYIPMLENEYAGLWNNMMLSLPNLIKPYQGACINCRGIKVVSNGFA